MRKLIFSILFVFSFAPCFTQSIDVEASSNFTLGPPYKGIGEVGASFRYNRFSLGLVYSCPIIDEHWRLNFLGIKGRVFFRDPTKKFNAYAEHSSSFQTGSVSDDYWISDLREIKKHPASSAKAELNILQRVNYMGYLGFGVSLKVNRSFTFGAGFGLTCYNWSFSYIGRC